MNAQDRWSWEHCREPVASLRGRLGFPDTDKLRFLGLSLDLRSGVLASELSEKPVPELRAGVFCILATYARAAGSPETFRQVSFRELPGGSAYAAVFGQRAALPLASLFSRDPAVFVRAVEMLGGIPVAYANHAWKLYALPRVPIYLLLWEGADEIPPSSALFFDASVPAYLETEAAAMLGELLAGRIASLVQSGGDRIPQGNTR